MDSSHSDARGELNGKVKAETANDSSRLPTTDNSSVSKISSSTPLPSTETSEASRSSAPGVVPKKKGVATAVKKTIKRPKSAGPKSAKKAKTEGSDSQFIDEDSGEDGSDGGPYCLCRGADDHRWMICCEFCDDWFHGECIDLSKEVGENLIEKFVCPNCTDKELMSIYKKTCSIPSCKKPARLQQDPPSYFCSNEHAQTWWERMVSRLPKNIGKAGLTDQLTQDEFMALLSSGLSGVEEDGTWKVAKNFFASGVKPAEQDKDELDKFLSAEETIYVEHAAKRRGQIEDETALSHKMLALIEMARDRRRAAIKAGRIGEDICGYDQRLDGILARDAFAAFVNSTAGQQVFETSKLDDPTGEGDEVRGMCEKKRCKPHQGWSKVLQAGVERRIRELDSQAAEVREDERIVREAAAERSKRKRAEKNWVEVLDE